VLTQNLKQLIEVAMENLSKVAQKAAIPKAILTFIQLELEGISKELIST
jgi:hypothetical protein